MRTTLTLLKILRREIEAYQEDNCRSLCLVARHLEYRESITYTEETKLTDFIWEHKPKNWKNFDPYNFPEYKKQPRLKWLNYHINKLEKRRKK